MSPKEHIQPFYDVYHENGVSALVEALQAACAPVGHASVYGYIKNPADRTILYNPQFIRAIINWIMNGDVVSESDKVYLRIAL